LSASTSRYDSAQSAVRLLNGINEFFLGPQLGTTAKGQPIYNPDVNKLYAALTPAQTGQLLGTSNTADAAWTHTLSASANGELAQLPAGPLGAAVVAEVGRQGFKNSVDPKLGQGVFFNTKDSPLVTGSRDRYALGAELRVPLLSKLTATTSTRWDSYKFSQRTDSDLTYSLGLEYRPTDKLLLRANQATSFRAPDMNYLFTPETRGYYAGVTDYYSCTLSNTPVSKCGSVQPNYVRTGGVNLKSEHGESQGLGLVWSPTESLDLTVDYWRIAIRDETVDLSPDPILKDENACRTGKLDINSAQCQDALSRITRNPPTAELNPNKITLIRVNPVNAASTTTSGVDVSLSYKFSTERWGKFYLNAKYNQVLSYRSKQFAKDDAPEQVGTFDYSGWPDRFSGSVNWVKGDWSQTLTAIRTGRTPTADSTDWRGPYWSLNLSSQLQITPKTRLGLTVNNLLNTIHEDRSGGWPNYNVGYYQPYGRQYWLELNHVF